MKSLFCVPYCSIKLCAIYPLRWLESTRCRRATAFLCRRRCLAALFDKTYGCIVRTNDEHCSMMTCGDMVTYDVLRSGAFGTRDGDRLAVSCLCCRAMVEHHILFPKCWVFGHATWLHQKQVWDRGECPPSNKTDLGMWYKCIHWQWWVCRALSSFRMCHMPVASTCILEFAYACLCMLMLQFSLAWSLHGSDINRIMAVGRCVGESTLRVKIGHAKAKTLCLMHLVQSVSKPRHHPVVPVVFALSRGMSLCEGCARQRW